MRLLMQLIFSVVIFSSVILPVSVAAQQSQVLSFNQGWEFQKSSHNAKSFKPSKQNWQSVDLPHTTQIEPLLVNNQWQGIAVYQKQFSAHSDWKGQTVYIRFEGAMKVATVWLNGELLGKHLGGYLPFTFDISSVLSFDKDNVLVVELDNKDNYITGPKPLQKLDFNTYGGLYRDVNLIVKPQVHISDEMFTATATQGGLLITTDIESENRATVKVQTDLRNVSRENKTVTLHHELFFSDKLVATGSDKVNAKASGNTLSTSSLSVDAPQLWHPNSPSLYKLVTTVSDEGQVLEVAENSVGIRTFEFNDKHQLLINGEAMFLRGVNRHQEYPYVGYATSAEADYRDAYLIKSAGFDYVRLSHYPHSKGFMKAADELGLVLIDAVLGWQYYTPFPEFEQQIYQTCRDMIRRDRNHPSVLAWECSLNEAYMPDHFTTQMNKIVDEELPGSFSAGWQTQFDIYLQARQHRLQHYDTPRQPYNVSEYGDWEYYAQNAGLNQDAWGDLKAEERTSRQLITSGEKRLLQQATNIHEAHNDNHNTPAYSDGYWVMFDYNRGYADDLEASGVMSIFRQPKFSYYFYQSQRAPELKSDQYESGAMVYIASDWTKESATEVRVFSNTEKVALYLNCQLIKKSSPVVNKISNNLKYPPFSFDVKKFEAGELKAVGYINGKAVTEHVVRTPLKAKTLVLEFAEHGKGVNKSEGDVIFVMAKLIDENGTVTLVNDVDITFNISGAATLSNISGVKTEKGIATAVIKVERGASDIRVDASVDGLKAELTL